MSSFNRFLKSQFATKNARKEFFKNSIILLLVLFAIGIVYENAIAPYVNKGNASFTDNAPYFEEEDEGEEPESENIKLTNVQTSKIFWNDKPKRDPFSLHILKRD